MTEELFTEYEPTLRENLKLGKKLGRVVDPRTFHLSGLISRTELEQPPEQSYVGKGEPIQMYGNDNYGDCVFASQGHQIDVQERSSRQSEIELSTEDILAAYSAVTGFDPNRPETDNGAYLLDGLNYRRRVGIGKEADGTGHTIGAYASFDPTDSHLWKWASWAFGTVYIGVWLPLSAADQIRNGERWHIPDTPSSRDKPGSWGGHAICAVGYSSGSAVLATWGRRIRANWDWLAKYCDEAYAVISEDFLSSTGKTPQGFNVDQLTQKLANL